MDAAKINIHLNFQQIVDAVKQLSPKDKLKLNEFIWDENSMIPLEHQNIVAERIKEARRNPDMMLNWDEVSRQLTV
ncbi:MAG: addiction module protein [Mucilaginibacter sp.]